MLTISMYSFYNVYIFQNNILYLIIYNFYCQLKKIFKNNFIPQKFQLHYNVYVLEDSPGSSFKMECKIKILEYISRRNN